MPIMSGPTVQVMPISSRSAMSLEEIRDAMLDIPPSFEDLTGGWSSMDNYQSGLGSVGVSPPVSEPVIVESTPNYPRMLTARFYYWKPATAAFKRAEVLDERYIRQLDAIDVLISEADDDHVGMLFSTRSQQLLRRRDGVVKSLEKIFRTEDDTIRIDRGSSHLRLYDQGIFLWFLVQLKDNAQITPEILLDRVTSISGVDAASRTADLKAGVDFDRPNFLTSVAESDTFGPIEFSFAHYCQGEIHSYKVELHFDGGFRVRKNDVHFPDEIDVEKKMLRATYSLAFSIVPQINAAFVANQDHWQHRRTKVVSDAKSSLRTRYK